MAYTCDIGNGQRLLVQNDGDNTQVALSSGDSGQKQNQSTSFTTGEWSKPPELLRTRENLVLRLEGKDGVQFIGILGDQLESLQSEPKLENAEKLTLKESNEEIARMKPMEPMKPMN
jgi:hypothetical protein